MTISAGGTFDRHASGGSISLKAGEGFHKNRFIDDGAQGGHIYIAGGQSHGKNRKDVGGNVHITAGTSTASNGGIINNITSGTGVNSGHMYLQTLDGKPRQGWSAQLHMGTGKAYKGALGSMHLTTGIRYTGKGGAIDMNVGTSSISDGSNLRLKAGDTTDDNSHGGNIEISSGAAAK